MINQSDKVACIASATHINFEISPEVRWHETPRSFQLRETITSNCKLEIPKTNICEFTNESTSSLQWRIGDSATFHRLTRSRRRGERLAASTTEEVPSKRGLLMQTELALIDYRTRSSTSRGQTTQSGEQPAEPSAPGSLGWSTARFSISGKRRLAT